ncbi:solute carrier family 41 member 1-like [Haliotis asinina]|uniref:solute carrier family 41 member 1-like n=1 Tax=Haliotis asinina TaxID=109174 RepID=UPI003531BF0C
MSSYGAAAYSLRNRRKGDDKIMVPRVTSMTSQDVGVELQDFSESTSNQNQTPSRKSDRAEIHTKISQLPNGDAFARTSFSNQLEDSDNDDMTTSLTAPLLADDDDDDDGDEGDGAITARTTVVDDGSEEKCWSIAFQVALPYIIAGFGTVGAGLVLDVVQHWEVFRKVSEVFILVPSLLGLKGNLEMTLASRLSTQANLGNMEKRSEKFKMIGGNMALVQAQAIVVGFLASMAAMVMGWIPDGKFDVQHGLLLCASSIFTASVASLVLGAIMVVVVLVSSKLRINPDNVATPIAASLGDLTTLSLLAGVSTLLYEAIGKQHWLAPTIIVFFLLLIPVWVVICVKNRYVNDVIYSGWVPVISAMAISSIGGLILDFTVSTHDGIAVFQPVINGVGGNLVAVQASRISTYLHKNCVMGELPDSAPRGCPNPISTFFGSSTNSKAARVLLMLVVPGHLIFIYAISYMQAGHTSITLIFGVNYLTAAVLQVILLLYIANWMVHFIWRTGEDPDNIAIPYLTALGDLLGTGLLAIAFHILYLVGDGDADVGE